MQAMKVRHNKAKCALSGMCALTAPDVFEQDQEDGTIIVLQPEPPPAMQEAARDAAEICPTGAIDIEET